MKIRNLFPAIAIASCLASFASAQFVDIGLAQLRVEEGVANVNGAGVSALQVELEIFPNGQAAGPTYGPTFSLSQFTGKTFIDPAGNNNPSGDSVVRHPESVAFDFYGNSIGAAPGLGLAGSPPIAIAGANGWIFDDLGANFAADSFLDQAPVLQNFRVSNHSYIANSNQDFTQSNVVNALQRADWMINQTDMAMVVGTNNGSANPLPELFAQSYNVITVGRQDGEHASGLTTINGAGRVGVHLVSPRSNASSPQFTSNSAAVVSGSAAILHQTGSGITNSTRSEVIKATLLAGATKEEFSDWDQTAIRRLDEVYGAGELNIYNSHQIQQGGEFNGTSSDPASPVGENGWDFQTDLEIGEDRYYEIEVENGMPLYDLSVILNWNANVEDTNLNPSFFVPSLSVADLSLSLFDSSNGFLDTLIELSDSPVDNVEHLYIQNLDPGTYHLRVSNNLVGSIDTDYAIAFRSSTSAVPEPLSVLLVGFFTAVAVTRRNRI